MNALPVQDAARFRMKFTTVAHRSHLFCSPMSDAKAALLLSHLELRGGDRILDIGCGKAELLIRLAQQSDAVGVGVDRSSAFLKVARERAREAGVAKRISFVEQDAAIYTADAAGFAVGLCIGGGAAFGSFSGVARRMSHLVQPGGRLLLADCYWKKEPATDYLRFLGIDRESYSNHEGNLKQLRQLQLTPLWSTTSDDAEWDAYEELYRHNIEQYTAENPQDPDSPAMIERVRAWNRMYYDHGRSTLGFGFYLLKNEPPCLPE